MIPMDQIQEIVKNVSVAFDGTLNSDTVVEAGDHVILFVANKKYIRDVEKLFQVSAAYI